MHECHGELESIVPAPPLIEPVHSEPGMVCPCVPPDGSPMTLTIRIDYPVIAAPDAASAGGDYALAFVS